MDSKEKHDSNGDTAVEDQDDGELVQDHAEQTCCERNDDQPQ